LAEQIAQVVGWQGELVFNTDMPDGMPRKLLDVSQLERLGWTARIDLPSGLEQTYGWYVESQLDPR
jgi:GDP-L-fucose synthase